MAARHPDLIKLWLDDNFGTMPKMPPEVFQAVISEAHAAVDEAHRQGLRVAAHLFYLEDAKALVAAGVDILAHSVRDHAVDKELIAKMKANKVAYNSHARAGPNPSTSTRTTRIGWTARSSPRRWLPIYCQRG